MSTLSSLVQSFMQALVAPSDYLMSPSDYAMVLLLLLVVFTSGVLVGIRWSPHNRSPQNTTDRTLAHSLSALARRVEQLERRQPP